LRVEDQSANGKDYQDETDAGDNEDVKSAKDTEHPPLKQDGRGPRNVAGSSQQKDSRADTGTWSGNPVWSSMEKDVANAVVAVAVVVAEVSVLREGIVPSGDEEWRVRSEWILAP
jgi:hypothetical protein